MFRRLIVAGACIGSVMFSPVPVMAETFRLVSGNSNALMVADLDSVRRVGSVASFNTVLFSRSLKFFNGQSSWATQTAYEIDCRNNQRREVRASYLAEGGDVISNEALAGSWQRIPPATTGMAIRDLICEGRSTENNLDFGTSFARAEEMARRVLGH